MPVVVSFNFLDLSDNSVPLQIGAHGKPVVFLHPKDCGGVLIELEESWGMARISNEYKAVERDQER